MFRRSSLTGRVSVLLSLLSLIGLFPLATAVAAQATQARIVGVVTDGSGAVLPGVSVIATGPALQVPQVETVTNERGEYGLGPLPIGTYTVTYELQGFQTVIRSDRASSWWRDAP